MHRGSKGRYLYEYEYVALGRSAAARAVHTVGTPCLHLPRSLTLELELLPAAAPI